jgi:protein TonB
MLQPVEYTDKLSRARLLMSEKHVEKSFLYLLLFSLLVHAATGVLLLNLPEDKKSVAPEPLMVDLEGISVLSPPKEATPPVQKFAEERQRVVRETAPRGESVKETHTALPSLPGTPQLPAEAKRAEPVQQLPAQPLRERSPREELFRLKGSSPPPDLAALYPGSARLARLEENYRKKYGPEVAEGEASFLNTDDIQFGSFLRRFETAVYGVWRYPAEAAKLGIEGITPVKITFNRRGEIVGTELLQSSGSQILDNEVLRALKQIGPVGSFPKGYDKNTFNLIAFFHYGIMQGAMRSLR